MSALPLFDALESRRLMSVVPVTNTNDSGPGSLRAAMATALSGDVIDLRSVTGTINSNLSPFGNNRDLTLLGSGSASLTIHGGGSDPVFLNNGTLTIEGMTITGGSSMASSGGGIFNRGNLVLKDVVITNNHAFLYGGGIYSAGGDVTMTDCTLSGNTAYGALESSGAGLYMNGGKLTIHSSTIYNNTATGQSSSILAAGSATGGGIYLLNTSASTITNSTFGANTAQGGTGSTINLSGTATGGAIYINTAAPTLFNSCTIAYNDATGGGTALNLAMSSAGGMYSTGGGTVSMLNTLSAENDATLSPDILSSNLASLGDNLVGVCATNSMLSTLIGDKFGSVLVPLAPGLSTVIANNGGTTMTYALQSASAAINSGTVDAPAFDQRGLGRRNRADIGAFEFNGNHLPVLGNAGSIFNATAGVVFTQAIPASDADNDTLTYTAINLPSWLKFTRVNGVPTFTGAPTEADAGTSTVTLMATDGFNPTSISFKIKVGIPSIALSSRGLLRVNGTDAADTISIFAKGNKVRVIRDGVVKNFAQNTVRAIQIYGFGGDDTISVNDRAVGTYVDGGEGNDLINGGAGYDILSGGMGNDTIYGNGGDDRLNGNAGNDVLYGGDGNDRIFGGKGRDKIFAGSGLNQIWGEEGNDFIDSKNGTFDIVDGGDGSNSGLFDKIDSVINAVLAA